MKRLVMMLALSLILVGCNKTGDSSSNSNNSSSGGGTSSTGTSSAEPTKDEAVKLLRAALAALEAKDYTKAAALFKIPAGASTEEINKQLARLLELQEISSSGIDILAKDGKWGKLDQTFEAEQAKRIAERAGVPLESCYGLTLKSAEAGFYWDGKQFKIIRCDDIGKLG